jgi:hypothetical protein
LAFEGLSSRSEQPLAVGLTCGTVLIRSRTQVMRYSALLYGIGYGAYNHYSLQKQADKQAWSAERAKRQGWVDEARKLYNDKYGSKSAIGGRASPLRGFVVVLSLIWRTVVTNPEDPSFDLEKLIMSYAK